MCPCQLRERGVLCPLPQVHGQAEVQVAVRSLDAAAAKAAGEALAKVAASKDGLAMLNRVQPAAAATVPQADAPRPGHAAAAPMHAAASRGQAAQCATRPAQPAQALVQAAAGGMAGPEMLLAVSEKKDERAAKVQRSPHNVTALLCCLLMLLCCLLLPCCTILLRNRLL